MGRPFLQMFAGRKEEFIRKTGKLPGQDDTKCGKSQERFSIWSNVTDVSE
jgi:hypothetical protein